MCLVDKESSSQRGTASLVTVVNQLWLLVLLRCSIEPVLPYAFLAASGISIQLLGRFLSYPTRPYL